MEIPDPGTPCVTLGQVTVPSGQLLIIDPGLLHLWKHDQSPVLEPGGFTPRDMAEHSCTLVDLAIEGEDAAEAGRLFDRQGHPLHLFDVARKHLDGVLSDFRRLTKERKLKASIRELPERVPHRERVRHVLDAGGGAGEVWCFGFIAAAVRVPSHPLEIVAQAMPGGPHGGRWRHALIDLAPGVRPARSREIGVVTVEHGLLMAADVDALAAWKQDESLDGLGDYTLRGPEAEQAAKAVGAKRLGEDEWGWTNLPMSDLYDKLEAVRNAREKQGLKFGEDFSPHSHYHQLIKAFRTSEHDSAIIHLAGASLCGFDNSWGDFAFPVFLDLDAKGLPVRIRVDLGNEKIVRTAERVVERYKLAIVSLRVIEDGEPVRWLYRQKPDHENDSGWRIFSGEETPEYLDDPNNADVLPIHELIERDSSLGEILEAPSGSAFERKSSKTPWIAVKDLQPGD